MPGILDDGSQQPPLPIQLQPPQGGNFGAGLMGFLNAGSLPQALGNLIGGLATGQRYDPQGQQQQYLNSLYQSLIPKVGEQNARILALNPQLLQDYTKIEKLGPGEAPYAPLDLLTPSNGAPAGMQGQPSQQPQGGGFHGPMNTAGMMTREDLAPLVDRRLHGDVEAANEVKSGMSGMNPLNNELFQRMVSEALAAKGMTGADLARIDAKFPAYKKAQLDLGDMQAKMGTAQIEFGKIWPQFMQAYKTWAVRYPQTATQFPTGNAFLQFLDKNTGDPSVAPLKQYVTTLRNIYGRAISTRPQGPTDSDKAHFDEGVNTYWNKGQMEQLGGALDNEMTAAQGSIPVQRNVTDVEYGFGKDPNPADVAAAKAAIAKGADKQKIMHRFKEGGFNAPQF